MIHCMPDTHAVTLEEDHKTYTYMGVIDGTGYSEGLKGSWREHIVVQTPTIRSGKEDCFDFVRGKDIVIRNALLISTLESPCRQYGTIKGGIQGFALNRCRLEGSPRGWFDFVVGDFTIYDFDKARHPCRDIIFDDVVHVPDLKRKVSILVLYAERVEGLNGRYRIIRVPRWIVKVYFTLCRLLLKDRRPPDYIKKPYET